MTSEHAAKAKALQLAFLTHLLTQPNCTGSVNGATNAAFRREAYRDGGKWVGPCVTALKLDGIIRLVLTPHGKRTADVSNRISRKGGSVNNWQIADEPAARRKLAHLEKQLKQNHYGSKDRSLFDEPA